MPTVLEQQDRAFEGSVVSETGSGDGEVVNEKALLIENMELVEAKKAVHVPNHLLETKTFAKVGQNAFIHSKPSVIHFEGFEVGQKQTRQLVLLNASSDVLRMHIIPPQTNHFYIKYKKPARMVAGMTLECVVEFTPDEWRYYYDCIRVHCPGEENLLIPIHGYPIMSTKDFPRHFTFQPIPVGHRHCRTFPLKSMAPIDFEFNIKYVQPHPAFLVEPLSGIVPANSETEISVTFAPFEFQTATMKLELAISQFNSKGTVCTFIGNSQPGLLKTKTMTSIQSDVLDPRCLSPLDRVRSKKKRLAKDDGKKTEPIPTKSRVFEKGGIRFPANLNNPHGIAKVMMQEPGKLKVNEMRENMLAKKTSNESTRQMKEAVFDHSVRQNVYEERQNQLRWQVKIGDDPISAAQRFNVFEERKNAIDFYMFKKRGDPVIDEEYLRPKTVCTYKRTLRDVETVGSSDAMFDTYSNDLWAARHAALSRFVQAARKIIIRLRAGRNLTNLKNFLTDWGNKTSMGGTQASFDKSKIDDVENTETSTMDSDGHLFWARKIQSHKFPTYVTPNVKDDMAPDALGEVTYKPTEITVKRDVPFFNLKVPHFYKLQGYKGHNSHIASSGYVPTKRIRTLRTGAEDELIKIASDDAPCVPTRPSDECDKDEQPASARAAPTTAATTAAAPAVPSDLIPTASKHQPVSVTPPESLFNSMDYPSLHIMNPAPGLQVFQAPKPYAEVDYDFHLCPLPRYPRNDPTGRLPPTQKKFLDREDTIRGIMGWKKFPSQGLTSLSNTPTLTNVWVPRWDDCFSTDLLPEDVPPLFDQLAPDDAENVIEEDDDEYSEEGSSMNLKPEMINAQFTLIDPSQPAEDQKTPAAQNTDEDESEADLFPYGNRMPSTNIPVGPYGPVAREKREEELEYFMTKKSNRLGSKVKSKVGSLTALVTDNELVLK